MPIIPAFWEAKLSASLESRSLLESSMASMVKSHLYKKINWAWWHMPVVPATWEAEVRGSLEPGEVEAAMSCD